MGNDTKEIELHVAGATVRHESPFLHLAVPTDTDLSVEFIEKWVLPFYMVQMSSDEFLTQYLKVRKDISPKVVYGLLGEFNWRPRSVAADFAAIENLLETEKSIGNLLLRSELCYAGAEYCLALASFNTKGANEFLREYLDYYLKQPALYFDQDAAMGAIAYLDEVNGTEVVAQVMPEWDAFVRNKPHWSYERCVQFFRNRMNALHILQQRIGSS